MECLARKPGQKVPRTWTKGSAWDAMAYEVLLSFFQKLNSWYQKMSSHCPDSGLMQRLPGNRSSPASPYSCPSPASQQKPQTSCEGNSVSISLFSPLHDPFSLGSPAWALHGDNLYCVFLVCPALTVPCEVMVKDGGDSVCAPLLWQRILTVGRNHSMGLVAERSHQQTVKMEISVLVHKLALSFYGSMEFFRWVCFFCLCDIN